MKDCQWCGRSTDELFIVFDRDTLQEVGICGECQIEIDNQLEVLHNAKS
jgi:hypothetical protein